MQQPDSHPDAAIGKALSVLVLADGVGARVRAEAAVKAAGARVAATVPLSGALEQLGKQVVLDMVMIELEEDGGPALDAVLDEVEALARAGRCVGVIAMPRHLIDAVSARIGHAGLQLLCEPDPVERAAAIGSTIATRNTALGDVSSDAETRRLRQLSEEVGRIARTLAMLSKEVMGERSEGLLNDRTQGYHAEQPIEQPVSSAVIRTMIRGRRLRDRFFHAELFADPAWDMLLDLMAARVDRINVAVSSLCIAASVPPTTALRWIRTMTDNGLFLRRADPADGRRVFIALSDAAAAGMNGYFAALRQTGAIAI